MLPDLFLERDINNLSTLKFSWLVFALKIETSFSIEDGRLLINIYALLGGIFLKLIKS